MRSTRIQGPRYDWLWNPDRDSIAKILFARHRYHYRCYSEYSYFGTSLRDKWTQLQVV